MSDTPVLPDAGTVADPLDEIRAMLQTLSVQLAQLASPVMGLGPPGRPVERSTDLTDHPVAGAVPEITTPPPEAAVSRRRRSAVRAASVAGADFLSIASLTARWNCARSTTYEAIKDMERGGYLKRVYLGRVQRISMESIEEFERQHAHGPGEVASRLRPRAQRMKRLAPATGSSLRSMSRAERILKMREYTRSLG